MKQDILIVGAGPTGLTAALELARRGISARIIDKAAGPTPIEESRALAVNMRSLDILQASGVSDEMRKVGNRLSRLNIIRQGRQIASLDITEFNKDAELLVLRQGTSERIILAALSRVGIEVEWNVALDALTDIETTPKASLVHSKGNRAETATPDMVIGCDGAHSPTRKAAGISFAGKAMDSNWALADVTYKTPIDHQAAVANLLENGVFAMFPIDQHTYRYVTNHSDVIPLIKNQSDIDKIGWQTNFNISFRLVEAFSRGKVFLAGDAAHVHSPVGGRGMNLGIEDAAWLAWSIENQRSQQYSDDRLITARKVLKGTHIQTKMLTTTSPLIKFLRDRLTPLALKFPAVRRGMVRALTGYDTPVPPWL